MDEPLRFGAAPDDDVEPVEFWIADEKFTCIRAKRVPASAMRVISPADDVLTVPMMFEFVEGVLEDKDDPKDKTKTQIERFQATMKRKDVVIDTAELREMVISLIGAITTRPTRSPSGSTGGRRLTKAGSKVKPSGRALTSTG